MREAVEAFGIFLDEAKTEARGVIGTARKYRAPMQLAYKTICADIDFRAGHQESLHFVHIAAKCTVKPADLFPALLDFGAIPSPARTVSTVS